LPEEPSISHTALPSQEEQAVLAILAADADTVDVAAFQRGGGGVSDRIYIQSDSPRYSRNPPLYSSDLSRNHVAVGTEEAELGAGGMDLVASTMVLFSLYTCHGSIYVLGSLARVVNYTLVYGSIAQFTISHNFQPPLLMAML